MSHFMHIMLFLDLLIVYAQQFHLDRDYINYDKGSQLPYKVDVSIKSTPGDVTGQFTAAPPTCPGDTFTFRCTVRDMNGVTIWRVNSSRNLCTLSHLSTSESTCGPSNNFTATPETGYGTNATFYSSTLRGTATSELNGTLIECFGPAISVDPGNRINGSTLMILGEQRSFY